MNTKLWWQYDLCQRVFVDEMNLQLLQDNYLVSYYHHSRINDITLFAVNIWMKQVDKTELYVYKAQITKERGLYLKILYILDWGELRKPCSQHQCKERDEEIPMPA